MSIMKDLPVSSRFWNAYITLPGEEHRYYRNTTIGVVADTLEGVVEKVRAKYPDARIWTIQHRGPIHEGLSDMKTLHDEDMPKQVKC